MKLTPSKNPNQESRLFTLFGIACFGLAFIVWFTAIAGLAFSIRGIILSYYSRSWKSLTLAIVGLLANAAMLFQ